MYLLLALESAENALTADGELLVIANGPDRLKIKEKLNEVKKKRSTTVLSSDLFSLSHCLNIGVERARGEYIARMDSDDICLPDRFLFQSASARESGADLLFADATRISGDGVQQGRMKSDIRTIWNTCGLIHPTAFIRRDSILKLGGYGNLEYSEDYHLWLRALSTGLSVHLDSMPVIAYREHSGQATAAPKLFSTFGMNAGIKLALGLRHGDIMLFVGAGLDVFRTLYVKFRVRIISIFRKIMVI